MQQKSTEEVKEVPFDNRLNAEGSWGLRGLKKRRGFAEETHSV